MQQSKKSQQWYFGMKCHIGVDADSGLVHTVRGTAGNVNDVVEANSLPHGQETDGWGDAGYRGLETRPDAKEDVRWHVTMRPSKRKALDQQCILQRKLEQIERLKASVRPKLVDPFRIVKQQFGYAKVRYRGLAKNTARLAMLFALGNLKAMRHRI